ncbi:hypothetical protein EON83_20310 [bacterium]|nr:MAG: hypothetical protein EON83_20310 [bacterium]
MLNDIIISPNDSRIEDAIDTLLENHSLKNTPEAREAARSAYWGWLTAAIEEHILCDLSEYAHGPNRLTYEFKFDDSQFESNFEDDE